MNAAQIESAIQNALQLPLEDSSAWSPPGQDRFEYLSKRRDELEQSLIEPFPVDVTPDESARTYGDWEDRPYTFYVVAKSGRSALFLNPETGMFSLGTSDIDGSCKLLGFASPDLLAEWVD